jgi:hypothetical protein
MRRRWRNFRSSIHLGPPIAAGGVDVSRCEDEFVKVSWKRKDLCLEVVEDHGPTLLLGLNITRVVKREIRFVAPTETGQSRST